MRNQPLEQQVWHKTKFEGIDLARAMVGDATRHPLKHSLSYFGEGYATGRLGVPEWMIWRASTAGEASDKARAWWAGYEAGIAAAIAAGPPEEVRDE